MKVKFENMQTGWVDFTLSDSGGDILKASFSYTPYDSFDDLVRAIDSFRDEYKTTEECKVVLNTEPYEYELKFSGTNNRILFSIKGYPSHKREIPGEEVYKIMGNYSEVCIPFWRALRSLQGLHSSKELDELWHREFPSNELNILTNKIR